MTALHRVAILVGARFPGCPGHHLAALMELTDSASALMLALHWTS